MYYSTQKWAFYFGKSADFFFRISVWNVEFCVVANRSCAFFGVCDFELRTLFYFNKKRNPIVATQNKKDTYIKGVFFV